MNFLVNQYFVLIVPVCALLQGIILIGCWLAMRQHRYLLWVSAGYILSAIPLAAQSVMDNKLLATWSVITATFYMAGIWCAAKGMALKANVSAHPRLAFTIGIITLCLLFNFSIISDQLWYRMIVLNSALFILTALPLGHILRQASSSLFIERLLRISFIILVLFALLRTVMVCTVMKPAETVQFSQSLYWLVLLASSMIISLLFTFSLLACAVKDTILMLKHERNQDSLTHLLNRRAFFELAEHSMNSLSTDKWAVIMCDIDHFKQVNDTWGHAIGDRVLKKVGESLLKQSREGDLVTRFGGEEFVILVRCRDLMVANTVAQRMRTEIELITFTDMDMTLTASFGIAMVKEGKLKEAIAQADILLYQAKNAGRNQVFFKDGTFN